jgi:hypothetical protein
VVVVGSLAPGAFDPDNAKFTGPFLQEMGFQKMIEDATMSLLRSVDEVPLGIQAESLDLRRSTVAPDESFRNVRWDGLVLREPRFRNACKRLGTTLRAGR